MKITLYEFLKLPDQEQYDITFHEGINIDLRIKGNKRFALYSLCLFFVEVEYNSENNKIVNKRAFVQGELLDKYTR